MCDLPDSELQYSACVYQFKTLMIIVYYQDIEGRIPSVIGMMTNLLDMDIANNVSGFKAVRLVGLSIHKGTSFVGAIRNHASCF